MTTLSTAIKTDSTYQVRAAIPKHTITGIKTDSGSGVTLIKKTVAEEIPGLPPVQPATKLIQSSEGSAQTILESIDLYLKTDPGLHSKTPSYLYDTSAPFDVNLGTDFLQQEQAVMAWTTEGLRTFLISGLAKQTREDLRSSFFNHPTRKFRQSLAYDELTDPRDVLLSKR